ncbi:MAG: hypothetical protein M1812_006779 [Candelaria pacifica]|nr:MAG: hypothetical protein M1812_006779 [Candelaria pacifica]
MKSSATLLHLLALGAAIASCQKSDGPTVDLGYGLWKASINETGRYYNFSNIRYAQPPVGNLRFGAPLPPLANRTSVNDGQDGRVCPQGSVQWSSERALFIQSYFSAASNISDFTKIPPPGINPKGTPPGQADGRANEDCLFLDVIVPEGIYNGSNARKAPVMVWLFGGGFYSGSKDSQGNPAGLVSQSVSGPASSPGAIFVAINYRIGALGWLAGPTFTQSGGLPNAGFHDQRLALTWIQQHIELFGGDPDRVTLMGESAGASSTLHHITAYAGSEVAPFQQAVIQSPAFNPNPYNSQQEDTFNAFLKTANVTSLSELRALSSAEIIAANEASIYNSTYGATRYGPVIDGTFVPQLPTLLLASGKFAPNIRAVFAGQNTDEGFLFTNPAVQNSSAFNSYLSSGLLADSPPQVLDYVTNTLYPPVFNNQSAYGYNDTISRLATLTADILLTCNVDALMRAYSTSSNKPHAYLFDEGAGLHGEETPYTFYNNGPEKDVYNFGTVNATVAETLQSWIVNFVATGDPNASGTPSIQPFGANRTLGLLANKGLGSSVTDPAGKARCDFWQKGLYY